MRGYRRLLVQAVKLLEPSGVLAMCCCSGLIERQMLHDLLAQEASPRAGRCRYLEKPGGVAADHPASVSCPETNYSKCVVCRVA